LHFSNDFGFGGLRSALKGVVSFRVGLLICILWVVSSLLVVGIRKYVNKIEFDRSGVVLAGALLDEGQFAGSESETSSDDVKWVLNKEAPNPNQFDNFRPYRRHIKYREAFSDVPYVLAAIDWLDIPLDQHIRLLVSVEDKSRDGCDIIIYTWNASKLTKISVHWVAIQPSPTIPR
jgi:H-type lectin domain